MAEGLDSKHAVEQVDRLLSNGGIPVWSLFESWAPYVVGDWPEFVTAHDWTDWPACGRHAHALRTTLRCALFRRLLGLVAWPTRQDGARDEVNEMIRPRRE
jgi:hypothetical protein